MTTFLHGALCRYMRATGTVVRAPRTNGDRRRLCGPDRRLPGHLVRAARTSEGRGRLGGPDRSAAGSLRSGSPNAGAWAARTDIWPRRGTDRTRTRGRGGARQVNGPPRTLTGNRPAARRHARGCGGLLAARFVPSWGTWTCTDAVSDGHGRRCRRHVRERRRGATSGVTPRRREPAAGAACRRGGGNVSCCRRRRPRCRRASRPRARSSGSPTSWRTRPPAPAW